MQYDTQRSGSMRFIVRHAEQDVSSDHANVSSDRLGVRGVTHNKCSRWWTTVSALLGSISCSIVVRCIQLSLLHRSVLLVSFTMSHCILCCNPFRRCDRVGIDFQLSSLRNRRHRSLFCISCDCERYALKMIRQIFLFS